MKSNLSKKLLLGALGAFIGAASATAIPPKPGPLTYPMSDGTTLEVTIHGDGQSGYYLSSDGYVLLPGPRGDLYYAALKGSTLTRSAVKASLKNRTINDTRYIESLDKESILAAAKQTNNENRSRIHAQRRAADREAKALDMITTYPTIGSPNALILLVQFKDIKFRTPDPLESFTALTKEKGYSHNGATGSALDYFIDNSSGLFTPNFQIYGPVTLDNNESYYGEAEGTQYDRQAWKIATEGCQKLHEMHPELDFSQFDNDGDGFVDNVFIYYAGYGQNSGASSWTIWPHAANVYTFYGANVEFNGVKLGNYACTNELRGTSGTDRTGIGTFCHEFSHILGLPDLYATNNSGGHTPYSFELMDIGSYNNDGNTPPYMSAFDRMSVGWLKPRDLSGPENVTLNSIASNEALRIPTVIPEEYFILENRQKTGWDTYIGGHGMLIWHIDYDPVLWADNHVNNNSSHLCVDIIEADNIANPATLAGDPFPGTGRITSFTSTSIPAMRTWIGVDPEMPLTDIRETDGLITFKVKGGGDRIDPVSATEASDITATSFTANWNGRPEIAQYEIDLCIGNAVVPSQTVKVKNATSHTFQNLQPSTSYSYLVRAVDGDMKSLDSNKITVQTADPTFDMLAATALPAEDVYDTQFTARWEPLNDADSYELTVYTKDIINPKAYTADFTAQPDNSLVPDGWYTNCNATDSRSGYFGQARPALKMSYNSDQVQTPVFNDDVNYIRFWYRGNASDETDHLDVEGLIGGAWQTLHAISPIDSKAGHTVEIGNGSDITMPVGVKAIRIIFRKTGGSGLCIDDIVVGAGGSYVPVHVASYDPKNVGAVVAETVKGLTPSTTYYYTVCGVNGDLRSLPSGEIAVTTPVPGAIDDIDGDNTDIIIADTPEGVEVTNNDSAEHTVECVSPSGIILYSGSIRPGATLSVKLPLQSITIVKCSTAVAKVLR